MKNLLAALALAFAGLWLAPSGASATTITVNPDPLFFDAAGFGKNEVVNNAYQFSLTGVSDVLFGTLSLGIKDLGVNLCRDEACTDIVTSATPFAGPPLLSLGFASGLGIGTYFLVITGIASKFGGGYIAGIAVLSATPVPPALLMFLTALGGLGFFGYRRRALKAAA